MNREEAVIKAAGTLGMAAQRLAASGYAYEAKQCKEAIDDLQSSVAESRALDLSGGRGSELVMQVSVLLTALTQWLKVDANRIK